MLLHLPFRWNQSRFPQVNLALGAVRTVLEYVAVVMGGAALLTGAARGLGILPSPAPTGLLASILAALITFIQLLGYPRLAFVWVIGGILLFACARLTTRLPGPAARPTLAAASLILSVIVAAFSNPAWVPVLFTPAMGYIVSQSVTAMFAGLMGGVFGFFLLPRVRAESLNMSPMRAGHWIAAVAWILFFAIGFVQTQYRLWTLANAKEPRLNLVYARWVPGEEAVREEPIGPGDTSGPYLTAHELEELRSAGLTGVIQGLGSQVCSSPSCVRFVVIMSRPVQETVDLPKPASGNILYIQTQQGWRKFPASAPTIQRTVRLLYFPADKYFSLPTMRPHVDVGLGHPDPKSNPWAWTYAPTDWPADRQVEPPYLPEGGPEASQ